MKELYIKPSTEIILSRLQLLAPQSMEIEVSEEDDRTIQTADEYMFADGTTGKYCHIDESPVIRVDGTSLNRFYLVRGDATCVENMLAETRDDVSISFAGNMLTDSFCKIRHHWR